MSLLSCAKAWYSIVIAFLLLWRTFLNVFRVIADNLDALLCCDITSVPFLSPLYDADIERHKPRYGPTGYGLFVVCFILFMTWWVFNGQETLHSLRIFAFFSMFFKGHISWKVYSIYNNIIFRRTNSSFKASLDQKYSIRYYLD